jgi:hypothetical protein
VEEPVVIARVYDLLLWILPRIEKFPRSQRFVLGERLERTLYDLLEALIEARWSKDRRAPLRRANLLVDAARYYVRLSRDLKLLTPGQYHHGGRILVEIGQQVGGWSRAAP